MIVRPIQVNDVDMAMRLSVNPYIPPEVTAYIENSHKELTQKVGNFASNFINKVQQIKNYFNNNTTLRKLRSVLTRSEAVVNPDAIHILGMSNLHNPSLRMRTYLMANPTMFRQFRKGRLVAYNDEWKQNEIYTPPTWRREYMEVVDGLVRWKKGEDEGYTEHMIGEENRLTFEEQVIVKNAWDLMESLLANGVDPTGPEELYKKYVKGEENE